MAKSMSGKMATAKAPIKALPAWRKRFEHNMKILSSSSCRPCRRQSYIALLHQKQQIRAMKQSDIERKKPADATSFVVIGPKTGRVGEKAEDAAGEIENMTDKKRKVEAAYLKDPPASKRAKQPTAQDPTGEKAVSKTTTSNQAGKSASRIEKPASSTSGKTSSGQEPSKPGSSTPGGSKSKPGTPKSTPPATPTSSISKLWPTNVGTQKTKGILNPANYCYRNAALQSLLCIPQLLNLLNTSHKTDCQKACVVCRLRDLANAYHGSPGNYKSVDRQRLALEAAVVRCRLQSPKWLFKVDTQQDSHEFLIYLLQWVEQSQEKSKDNFNSIYNTAHRRTYTCHKCNIIHTNDAADPPASHLTLPVKGKSLSVCMDRMHADENLQIRCDRCKVTESRVRTTKIISTPEVLYIQLGRFTGSGGKNCSPVRIPEHLDLSRWAEKTLQKENMLYELKAVALHIGSRPAGGHYSAVVKSGDKWFHLNDTDVRETNFGATQGKGAVTPYVLTYVKVDPRNKSP